METDLDYSRICACGHPAGDHHISYFAGGGVLVEECEFYGWNEAGGMMPDDLDSDADEWKWVDHCQRFKPIQEAE